MTTDPRPGRGRLIVVVGPSGSGKDTVIDYARECLRDRPEVMFVRRVVTRDAEAGSEDHDSLDRKTFDEAERQGRFAFAWEAHGLRYGLPASLSDHVAAGGVAVANGSRAALPALRERLADVFVVELEVPPEILEERLRRRGREGEKAVAARLERASRYAVPDAVRIRNDGPVEDAGEAFVSVIEDCLRPHLSGAQA